MVLTKCDHLVCIDLSVCSGAINVSLSAACLNWLMLTDMARLYIMLFLTITLVVFYISYNTNIFNFVGGYIFGMEIIAVH